jgi:hypothetical protein
MENNQKSINCNSANQVLTTSFCALNEVYFSKIEKANELQTSMFLFDFENKHYLVEWRNQKWTNPIEVQYL